VPVIGRTNDGTYVLERDTTGQGWVEVKHIRLNVPVDSLPAIPEATIVTYVRAKIEIVWPHGNAPVKKAQRANITAMLFTDPVRNTPPPCNWNPTVRLWAAYNQEPAHLVGIGEKRLAEYGGRLIPVWDFNDVDVSFANDVRNKIYFFVTVDGVVEAHNVWTHGVEARTLFPRIDQPHFLSLTRPVAVDAKIETLIPRNGPPPRKADILVYLFPHGKGNTTFGPNLEWHPRVHLYRALNAAVGPPEGLGMPGRRVLKNTGNVVQWVWKFENVDISAAQRAGSRLFFWVQVDGVPTYTNVWAYGLDARTFFPRQDTPDASCR